ncbi:hypothetical protein C7I87_11080 [Mesorhizobium sp. SARCC-RB16n]|uniref:LysR family transcriptional regulator n=1 Tax=Mesorhizobium sp. SARCC-RB16n TaxID=2116687 RepID=UPI00122F1E94|nr:hypothetical protein C7I87_11080 [Mesorhizobium sp. SARCC-RB16n]
MTRNGNAIQLLTYAFAAVDHGSMRQAARALRVQESSVSRNVVKLEQQLDIQLFERDARGVRLTKTGRAWIEIVRAHYDGLLDAFAERVRDNKDAKTLRIGLCCVTGGEFLKRLIERFGKLYPDVRLTIEDVPSGQCLSAIRRRRFDLVFTHHIGTAKFCSSEVFWQERLFVLPAVLSFSCREAGAQMVRPRGHASARPGRAGRAAVGPVPARTHCGRGRAGHSYVSREPSDRHFPGAARARHHFGRGELCQDNCHRFRPVEASGWEKQR